MDPPRQASLARRFRELHRAPPVLVLPNVWDAASARIVEEAGFPAIATTSAGVAASLGYSDGQAAPLDEVLRAVERIIAVVRIPVSVDLEAGYGDSAQAVEKSCRMVLATGAIGINIEDGTGNPDRPLLDVSQQIEKLQAARAAGEAQGVPLVVNARTDVFLDGVGPPDARLRSAVDRANAYRAAGADCLFVPGVSDPETLAALARAVDGPLNVLAVAATPRIAELASLGVARVSLGSGPMRAALTLLREIASELQRDAGYRSFTNRTISHAEVNALFSRRGTD